MGKLFNKIDNMVSKNINNKALKIIIGVVVIILSLLTLYFITKVIGADTAKKYVKTVANNGLWVLVLGIIDFILIVVFKPLFGFTSYFENRIARKTLAAREKAAAEEIERQANETLKAAKAARKMQQK